MRKRIAQLILTALLAALLAAPAQAAPKTVNVRVEGAGETLFEGPVRSEGHEIESSSETLMHPCDGTNGGRHASPGATPTAATVDAMTLIGQEPPFSGTWFGGLDDYLVEQWGPEVSEHWGLLVDETFTAVGGCQIELEEGDRVLWAYDGTKSKGLHYLTLAAGSTPPGAAVPTATVALNTPLTVTVASYLGEEGVHTTPQPLAGAEVSPVSTNPVNDFQTVETASAETVTSEAAGRAVLKFTTPGWHRVKATASGALVSNRLDICVPAAGASDCGALPPDDQVRSLLPAEAPIGTTPPPTEQPNNQPPTNPPGSGVLGIGSSAPPLARTAVIRQLRIDGLLLTPLDDRASTIHYHGHWRRLSEAHAWQGTVTLGGAGASLGVRLAAGRPVLIVRDVHKRARIAVIAGGHRQTFTLTASSSTASRTVIAARRRSAGSVQVQILSGTIGIDGVAVTS